MWTLGETNLKWFPMDFSWFIVNLTINSMTSFVTCCKCSQAALCLLFGRVKSIGPQYFIHRDVTDEQQQQQIHIHPQSFHLVGKLKVDANCLKQQDIARYPWVKEVVEEEGTHLQSIRSFMVMVWCSNIFTCDNPNTSDDLVDAALVLPAHSHLASAWPFCSHVALLLKMFPYVYYYYIYIYVLFF